ASLRWGVDSRPTPYSKEQLLGALGVRWDAPGASASARATAGAAAVGAYRTVARAPGAQGLPSGAVARMLSAHATAQAACPERGLHAAGRPRGQRVLRGGRLAPAAVACPPGSLEPQQLQVERLGLGRGIGPQLLLQ